MFSWVRVLQISLLIQSFCKLVPGNFDLHNLKKINFSVSLNLVDVLIKLKLPLAVLKSVLYLGCV